MLLPQALLRLPAGVLCRTLHEASGPDPPAALVTTPGPGHTKDFAAVLAGLCCCGGVCLQRLHAVKGLSEAKADKMVEAAKKLTNVGSWITGVEAMQKVRTCAGNVAGSSLNECSAGRLGCSTAWVPWACSTHNAPPSHQHARRHQL